MFILRSSKQYFNSWYVFQNSILRRTNAKYKRRFTIEFQIKIFEFNKHFHEF